MPDKSVKIANDSPMIHGIVIRANIDSGTLVGVTLPKQDKRFFILGPEDVAGPNSVEVHTENFPLFAGSEINYKGQPIVALFGPDAETVEVKSREIEIDFELTTEVQPFHPKHEHSPIKYHWGLMDQGFAQAATVLERTYTDRRVWTREDTMFQVTTWIDDGQLKVKVPTQWPFHVRDTVASICARTKKSVTVYPMAHFSTKDEKILQPSILAAIAALATVKSNSPVMLSSRFPTYKSPIIIMRKTALDAQGKPIAEEVDAQIDQGAFPLFTGELFKQVLAGLIPLYPLEAFSAQVRIVESHSPPSHFFGDLGYSSALFSSEAHASAIARQLQVNPSNWRMKHYGETKERAKILETPPVPRLRDLIGATCTVSDFARHYAAYELQRRGKRPFSAFLNYTRGIGIACGAGISGFSTNSPYHSSSKISVTLDANDQVLVNSSFYPSRKITTLWRSVISKELSVDQQSVRFIDNDTSKMIDTGPEVLSLDIERSVMMIGECCKAIKAKRFQEPLPISETVSAKSIVSKEQALFSSKNWGCIILELEVNTITLVVEIRRVWGRFTFNNPPEIDRLRLKFRHIINESLNECNIMPIHREGAPPIMDIEVDSFGDEAYQTSATSALRAMVLAAASAALSQALNRDVSAMPITSEDIISYIRREE